MKVTIDIDYVTNSKPKKGYLVFIKNKLFKIESVSDTSVTMKSIYDDETYITKIENIIDKFIKFIAKSDKVIYSIIHSDYNILIDILKNVSEFACDGENKPYNGDTNEFISDIINNFMICHYKGETTKVYCKVFASENIVEITDIKIIDSYGLISKQDRLCDIQAVINKGKNSRYVLHAKTKQITINAGRSSFKIVGKPNYKELFTVKS